jgi:hypothetical protein
MPCRHLPHGHRAPATRSVDDKAEKNGEAGLSGAVVSPIENDAGDARQKYMPVLIETQSFLLLQMTSGREMIRTKITYLKMI